MPCFIHEIRFAENAAIKFMTITESRITIHMVSSLDGFIASKTGSVEWMHSMDVYSPGKTLTEEEIAKFLDKIDCYVMGSQTYRHALELGWPYGATPVFVLTSRNLEAHGRNITFCSGDILKFVEEHLKPHYQNIWMVGGAFLTKEFIRAQIADQIVISIMPVILGGGTLFFDYIGQEQRLHLKDVTAYQDGMVELSYEIIRDNRSEA